MEAEVFVDFVSGCFLGSHHNAWMLSNYRWLNKWVLNFFLWVMMGAHRWVMPKVYPLMAPRLVRERN